MRTSAIFVRVYLTRGVLLWGLTRGVGTFLLAWAETRPTEISVETRIHFVLLAVTVSLIDTRVRRENALLGNLGVPTLLLAMMFLTSAIVGEVVLFLAFGIDR